MGKDDKIEDAREVLEHVMRALNEIKAANVARMFKTHPIAASGGSPDLDEIVAALAENPEEANVLKAGIVQAAEGRRDDLMVIVAEVWYRQKFGVETKSEIIIALREHDRLWQMTSHDTPAR
jgi:phosphoribosylcarboxyaminoimidazole (NCAIR) mutase